MICNRCVNYKETFDEYNGWCWRCAAQYWAIILPECLTPSEIERAIGRGKCEFFQNKDKGVADEDISEWLAL